MSYTLAYLNFVHAIMANLLELLQANFGPTALPSNRYNPQIAFIACVLVRTVVFRYAISGELADLASRRRLLGQVLLEVINDNNLFIPAHRKKAILDYACLGITNVFSISQVRATPDPLKDLVDPTEPTPEGMIPAPDALLDYLLGPDRKHAPLVDNANRPLPPFISGSAPGSKKRRPGPCPSQLRKPSPLSAPPITATYETELDDDEAAQDVLDISLPLENLGELQRATVKKGNRVGRFFSRMGKVFRMGKKKTSSPNPSASASSSASSLPSPVWSTASSTTSLPTSNAYTPLAVPALDRRRR